MRGKHFGAAASPVQPVGAPVASAGIRRLITAFVRNNGTANNLTLTAPVAGTYRLVLMGAGGSGGVQSSGDTLATGGGSGGVTVSKPFPMSANQNLSVAVGAPAAQIAVGNGVQREGASGGSTTATLPDGTVLTAGGGGGGGYGGASTSPLAGGVGGTASGGEFNYPGNAGGRCTDSSSVSTAEQGGVDTLTVGNTTLKSIQHKNNGTVAGRLAASGGGAPPTAGGFLPIISGSAGAATTGGGASSQGSNADPFNCGWGSGAGASGSGGAVSSSSGPGGAFLILEVPLS